MKNILLLFSLSLLVLIGCKKEEGPTTLRGIVLREDTGEPVAGVEVGVQVEFKGSTPGNELNLDFMTTGDDGKFDLTVHYPGANEISSYELKAYVPESHELGSDYYGYLCNGSSSCDGYQPYRTYNDIVITLKTE